MFRVQFGGASPERALEHCCSCVQSLAQYTTVQAPDGAGAGRQLGAPRGPATARGSAAVQLGVSRLVGVCEQPDVCWACAVGRQSPGTCRLADAEKTE